MTTPLQDITLTMIVRDELMNPAGGLHAVLARHLPFFENVVVLDTGSGDGTRQLLEQMAGDYPQLRIFDAWFEGYGPARNTANGHVTTKYTFMLDADEMIEKPTALVEELTAFYGDYLSFKMKRVLHYNGRTEHSSLWNLWNPRLAHHKKIEFRKIVYETALCLELSSSSAAGKLATVPLLHFSPEEMETKRRDWYNSFGYWWDSGIPHQGPSQVSSFPSWKTPNPEVTLKYGVDVAEEMQYLTALGLRLHPGIAERLAQTAPQTI
ncbi:glycosyltransferase [Candidatus Woesearchaeota archaeon]|nr:glycosyltransferase [Candidatus Woesearchaeota archaeon]